MLLPCIDIQTRALRLVLWLLRSVTARQKSVGWLGSPWECMFASILFLDSCSYLVSIVQGLATMFGGAIIGLIYAWKIALVAMGTFDRMSLSFAGLTRGCFTACIPLLVATGFIRLVRSHIVASE